MKKLLLMIPSAVILLAACNTEKKTSLDTDKNIVFTDTSLLKQGNAATDVAANNIQPLVIAEKQVNQPKTQVRTITKVVRVIERQPAPKPVKQSTPPVVVETPTTAGTTTAPSNNTGGTTAGAGSGNGDVVPAPADNSKNEGWSKAAKGATIGGVGGAVAGAVIGKGAKGAAIGGIIGAAGGYILGRKADRKSGRVEYKN